MICWKKICRMLFHKSNDILKHEIYKLFILAPPIKDFPFTNHALNYFFQKMVIEIFLNNKIQIFFFSNEFTQTHTHNNNNNLCTLLKEIYE